MGCISVADLAGPFWNTKYMAISRSIWPNLCMVTGDNLTEIMGQKFGKPRGTSRKKGGTFSGPWGNLGWLGWNLAYCQDTTKLMLWLPKIGSASFHWNAFSGFQRHLLEYYVAVCRQIGPNLFIVTGGNPTEVLDKIIWEAFTPKTNISGFFMDPGQYFRRYILSHL